MDELGSNDVWGTLLPHEQFLVAQRAAARLAREWRETIPNVVGVGAGFRVRKGVREKEVVLQVLVRRKCPPSGAGDVPHSVPESLRVGGARLRCLVPTDVDPVGSGGPGGALASLDGGVVAHCDPWPPVTAFDGVGGTVAAVLTTDPPAGRQFLLGCHHVFTCSLLRNAVFGGWDPMPGARVSLPGDGSGLVGPTVRWTDLTPLDGSFGMDAALAEVWVRGGVAPRGQGPKPAASATAAKAIDEARLYTPRQGVPSGSISCQLSGLFERVLLPYNDTEIEFRLLYRYFPEIPNGDGDSGAPLIDGNGTWLGMHVWSGPVYDDVEGSGRTVAYAIPAWELLKPGLFADLPRLRLAP